MPRSSRFVGILITCLTITFFNSALAETFNGANASSTCFCSFKVIGLASDNTIIKQAAVECLGQDCASVVQLAVAPPLVPFTKSFTGVTVTSLSNTNNSASNLTALMTLSGDRLVVKDSQFLNLATSYDAILLLESGEVSMVNTSFVANRGRITGGVAVVGVGNMSFQSCKFLSNQGSEGGAIFVNGSASTCGNSRTCQLSINQSTFHNNTASTSGGGASIFGDGLAVTVSSSQFVRNTAGTFSPTHGLVGGGGALVVYSSSLPSSSLSSLLVTATNFTSNSGAYASGALYTGVADVSLKGCGFNNNTHMFAPYNIVGSAMCVDGVMALSVDTSSFWDNSGSAMVINSSAAACQTSSCVTNITKTVFRGNTAIDAGGALSLVAPSMQYNISQSSFVANTVVNGSAGAVFYLASSSGPNSPSKLNLINTEFINNMATAANTDSYGGAVFAALNGTSLQVDACVFEHNAVTATEDFSAYGGGLHVGQFGDVLINSGSFFNNTGTSGGAVSLGGSELHAKQSASIIASQFTNNIALQGGALWAGSLYGLANSSIPSAVMTLTGNTFSTNVAARDPAVYSLNLATTLSDCQFDKNSALLEGSSAAGFYGGVVRVLDTTFHENTSPSSSVLAGALFYTEDAVCSPSGTPKCRLDVVNSTFDSNRGSRGSGITVQSNSIQVSINSSTFRNNAALNGSGGAVKASATDETTTTTAATASRLMVTVFDCIMTGNTAEGSGTFILGGGAMSVSHAASLRVLSSTFSNNSVGAGGSGGGLYFSSGSGCNMSIEGVEDVQSTVPFGCSIQIKNSTFEGNEAKGRDADTPAAFFVLSGFQILVSKCIFASNLAAHDVTEDPTSISSRGAVHMEAFDDTVSQAYITNTSFRNNIGGVAGLSLVNMHCIAMVNTIFSNNLGGTSSAAFVRMVHGLPLMCIEAALNFAHEILSTPPLFVPLAPPDSWTYAVNFTNLAPHIFDWTPVNVDVRDCLFIDNSAPFAGSLVLEASSANIAVSNSTFRNNSVTRNSGGAVSSVGISNFEFYVTGCLFASNSASDRGGAMFFRSVTSLSIVWNSTFTGNQALSGGAIYVGGGALRINTTIMEGSQAGLQGGGAVTCTDCRHLEMKEVTLLNNSATELGGAVKVTGSQVYSVWLDQVQAHGNRAVSGGAVSIDSSGPTGLTHVSITGCNFTRNTAYQIKFMPTPGLGELQGSGGALRMFVSALWLSGTSFVGNSAASVGGAILSGQSCLQASQRYGYAVQARLADLVSPLSPEQLAQLDFASSRPCSILALANVQFEENTAEGAGGVIYTNSPRGFHTFCDGQSSIDKQIAAMKLTWNSPNGSSLIPSICPLWHNKGNSAAGYGPIFAFPAAQLAVGCSSADTTYTCSHASATSTGLVVRDFLSTSEVDSGGSPKSLLQMYVLMQDMMGQNMTVDLPFALAPQISVQLPKNKAGTVYGGTTATTSSETQQATFDSLLLRAMPGTYNVTFLAPDHPELAAVAITQVRACHPGEVLGSGNDTCELCPITQYSFDPFDRVCSTPCPLNANCSGGSTLVPVPGYYHSAPNSTIMHSCPNPDACRGDRPKLAQAQQTALGVLTTSSELAIAPTRKLLSSNGNDMPPSEYRDEQCSDGYWGRLCSLCKTGYGASGQFRCTKCGNYSKAALEYFGMLLLIVGINVFLIWRSLEDLDDITGWNKPQGSDYVQALLTHVQLASLLALMNIEWPKVLGGVFGAAAWMVHAAPQVACLDCILQHHTGHMSTAVARTAVQIGIPFVVLLSLCLFWVVYYYMAPQGPQGPQSQAKPRDLNWLRIRLRLTCYSVLGYFHPSITAAALNVFSCYPVDHPIPSGTPYSTLLQDTWHHGYWVSDMRNECFTEHHGRLTGALAVPVLFIFSIGFPLGCMLWLLYLDRQQPGGGALHDCDDNKRKMGYAYKSYRKACWWEGSVFQWKLVALALVVVNGRPMGTYLQTLLALCLFCIEHVYQQLMRPAHHRHLRFVQLSAIDILLASIIAALFVGDYQGQASNKGLQAVEILAALANIMLWLCLLCYICYMYWDGVMAFKTGSIDWITRASRSITNKVLRITRPSRPNTGGGQLLSTQPSVP